MSRRAGGRGQAPWRARCSFWRERLGSGFVRWLLVLMLTSDGFVWAHKDPAAPVPSFRALRVEEAMKVDGLLDEPFWQLCDVATGLIDTRTRRPAKDQTTVRVAYTREYLYLGVECLDSDMARIRATERREDRVFQGDDFVQVHIDPPHNHRGKYAFFTNPLGTRADANEGPSGQFNYGWSADWDCAAWLHADRWTFEMRIPLKVLNYFRTDGQSWGFNLTRVQRRTDTVSFWSFSDTDMFKPRHFGHLTELDLGDTRLDRNWEFTPYVSGRMDFNGAEEFFFSTGIDVGVRLLPTVSAALTVNPDFGQVEADEDTIELRDTERFLAERRLFFREGEELIRPPHRVYYSRRFTDIDAGLKATGMGRGFAFNFQNLQSDVAREADYYGNTSVLRVMQDVGERSFLGYYGGYSFMDEGESRVGSLDGSLFLNEAWRVQFQGAVADQTLESTGSAPAREGTGYLGAGWLMYTWYPLDLQLGYNAITDEFDPLIGYIPRRDIFGPTFRGTYQRKAGEGWYKDYAVTYFPRYYRDADGQTTLRDHEWFGSLLLRNDLRVRGGYLDEYHRPYDNHRLTAGVDVFASDYYKALNLTYATGEFQEIDYHEGALGKRIKFWERLPIREELVIRYEDRPDGENAVVWLNRLGFDLYLRSNMWVKGSIQIRDQNLHNYSLIYGWEFQHRAWLYLVYNDVKDNSPDSGRSVFAKMTYTF
jgi:hypothetical protein